MLNKTKAIEIAEEYVRNASTEFDLVLLYEHTIEFDLGWVFFYQTREYVETRVISAMISENAPVIVNKHDGSLQITGTEYPIEKYIRDYTAGKH